MCPKVSMLWFSALLSFILLSQAIAEDCKRVTVLKYFLEALCGQEEPLLAFKGGKYISVATSPSLNHSEDARSRQDSLTEKEVSVWALRSLNLLQETKRITPAVGKKLISFSLSSG